MYYKSIHLHIYTYTSNLFFIVCTYFKIHLYTYIFIQFIRTEEKCGKYVTIFVFVGHNRNSIEIVNWKYQNKMEI